MKNAIGILIGIAWICWLPCGSVVVLTILILLIQEYGVYFHLFVSSSVYFIGILPFSQYRSFTSLKWSKVKVLATQSCLTLCHPMGCSSPDSSIHGIFQTRIMSGLPFPSPGDLSHPGTEPMSPMSPAFAGGLFTTEPPSVSLLIFPFGWLSTDLSGH